MEGLIQRAQVAPEMQTHVIGARRAQRLQLGDQGLAAAAKTEAPALQRHIGVFGQTQMGDMA